ncbi:MAG: ABC-type transport system involved in cytochrome c biogenesis permease subunit, partial [Gammaproteobacteria bacterium]
QNDAVLAAAGMDTQGNDKRKSDRYSYNELRGIRGALVSEAMRFAEIDPKEQSPVQSQTLKLAHDLRRFDGLLDTFAVVGQHFTITGTDLQELYGGDHATLSAILMKVREFSALADAAQTGVSSDYDPYRNLFGQLDSAVQSGGGSMTLMPPPAGSTDPLAWWRVSDVIMAAFEGELALESQLRVLAELEALEMARGNPAAFKGALQVLHEDLSTMAGVRDEYSTIPLEVKLDRIDPFTNALVLFLLGFLVLAIGWLVPQKPIFGRIVWVLVSAGLALGVGGIVARCIIRSRPPVVSLYDTVLFVTCVVVLVALFAEWLTRDRVALGVAAVMGLGGMFLAGRYELKEIASSGDTMASVVAVLDTNYYLAIHVTSITMGYAGGLLAAGIAHVWILGKLFGFKRGDKKFYRTITRMTYGVLCFSLLFSIFGTIMGGVWANDSWGRFWGWDPKENGALLICIWSLLMLHLRMGRYIHDRGFAVMNVLGAIVISASWWGVNLLSIGLHSYGFTNGIFLSLAIFWGVELFVVMLSGIEYLIRRVDGTATA